MNKQVYHKWLARYLKEFDNCKKQKDINKFKNLVDFRLQELSRCLKQTIILDFEQELREKE